MTMVRGGRVHVLRLGLIVAIGIVFLGLQQAGVLAFGNGASGYSGDPATNGGATCTSCHSGGTDPVVSISGPATVDVGTTHTYTLTVTGAQSGSNPRGGLDVSVDSGALATIGGAGTSLTSGEIIHSSAKAFSGAGSISWDFQWTAPAGSGIATMYGAGLSGDGSGTGNDGTGTAQLAITVQEPVVNQAPQADAGGPYSGEITEFILFDASGSSDSDGSIVLYEWDFDGDLAYDASLPGPTLWHSYPTAGIYNVTVRVTDNQGATSTEGTQATVGAVENQPPTAAAGGPYSGTAGYPVQFDGGSSSDPESGILTFSWDFGDGSAVGSGVDPVHTYASAGTYTVTMTATDPGLESDLDTAAATVAANQAPTASAGGPYSAASGSPVAFSGSGSDPEGGTLTYSWDFGDGTPVANGSAPSHTYAAGTYTATLTVTDPAGARATDTAGVTVTGLSGASIYSARCASCHGAGGGGTSAGSSLKTSRLSLSQVKASLSTGSMASFTSGLSGSEINAVSSFTRNLQDPTATTTTLPANAGGSEIYAAECAGCHGASGQGGPGGSLQTSTFSLAQTLTIVRSGGGGMPGYNSKLTSSQIDAVSQHSMSLQDSSATTTTLPTNAGGAEVYAAECAGCHGAGGEGGVGPSLLTSTMSLADITAVTAAGLGSMPGYADSLTAEQIAAVSDFSLTLQGSDGSTPTPPSAGAALYATHCSACHGDTGQGAIGPALVDSELSLEEFVEITRIGAGAMHGFDETLTAEEIETIGSYMFALGQAGSLGDALGELTDPAQIYRIGCAACHGANGLGGIGSAIAQTQLALPELIAVISDGTEGMPGFGASLDADQLGALAEFVAGLSEGGSTATTTTLADGPTASPPSDSNSAAGLLVLVFGVLGGVTGGLILWRRRTQRKLLPEEVVGEPEESE